MAYTTAQLNRVMKEFILPGAVDLNFKNDPTLAFMKKNVSEIFPGGDMTDSIKRHFLYQGLTGGAYDWSGSVSFDTTTEQELLEQLAWDIKTYRIEINVRLEEMEIFNRGENATVDLMDVRGQAAALQMSKNLALALYQYGIDLSGGTGDNRELELNGLSEIVNDGSTDSYDGETFANYGGKARSSYDGLKAVVRDLGGAALTYPDLTEVLAEATVGDKSPRIGITSNLGLALVREAFQPQQVVNEVNAEVGFRSIQVDGISFMPSQYAPAGAAGAAITTDDNNEVLFLLTPEEFKFWVTASDMFGFGFSGFKPGRGDNMLSGQYFYAGNISCDDPRVQAQINGIGS